MQYDAFISYRHRDGTRLASALELALERLGRREHELRALQCFRDVSDQGTNADLDADLRSRIDASRYLLLIATPGAAESPWVVKEIEYWLATKDHHSLLIAVDQQMPSEKPWDHLVTLFPVLADVPMPKWTEFGQFADDQLTLANDAFVDKAAELSATISGRDKSELVGTHVREARVTASTAMARDAVFVGSTHPIEAVRLAGHALRLNDSAETRRALSTALDAAGHLVATTHHSSPATALAIRPDGAEFVTGHVDGSVRRWATNDAALLSERAGLSPAAVTAIDQLDDGRVAVGHEDGSIEVIDREMQSLFHGRVGDGPIRSLTLETQGGRVLCGWENAEHGTEIVVVDGTSVTSGPTMSGELQHLGFDGANAVAISYSDEIEIDPTGRVIEERFQPMLPAPGPRSYRHDRRRIAQANLDGGDITVTDEDHVAVARISLDAGFVDRLDFARRGELLAATQKGVVSVFDLSEGDDELESVAEIDGVGLEPADVAISPDGRRVLTRTASGVVVWSAEWRAHQATAVAEAPASEEHDVPRVLQAAIDVAWSADSTTCSWIVHPTGASGHNRWPVGATIATVDLETGTIETTSTGEAVRLRSLHDGVAVTSLTGTVAVWEGGVMLRDVEVPHPAAHDSVSVLGIDGGTAVTRDESGTLRLGRADGTVTEVGTDQRARTGWAEGATSDRRAVYSGIDESGAWIEVWDVDSGLVFERRGAGAYVSAVSGDGATLALATDDGFEIINLGARSAIGGGRLPGVTALALDQRGGTLAAATPDGTITVFDVASGSVTSSLAGTSDTVDRRLAFSPDGSMLAEASSQGALTVWSIDPAVWLRVAIALAGRALSSDERRRYGLDRIVAPPTDGLPA